MSRQFTFLTSMISIGLFVLSGCGSSDTQSQQPVQNSPQTLVEAANETSQEEISSNPVQLASAVEPIDDESGNDSIASEDKLDEAMMKEIQEIRKSVGISALPLSEDANQKLFSEALRNISGNKVLTPVNADSIHPEQVSALAETELIEHLQSTIEKLEAKAELEEAKQSYKVADRLRESAQSVRLAIRELR